jgi:hypothetical protein
VDGGWGGGRGSDREARAPRPRVRASSGEARRGRRERGGYYWRPVRQSYALAWPPVIGRPNHECRSVPASASVANGIPS